VPTSYASAGSAADRRARRNICGPFVWSNSYPTLVLRAATSRYGVLSKLLRILQSTYSVVTFAGPCTVSYQGISSRATPCTAQTQRRSLPGTTGRWSSPLACRAGHYYSRVLCFVSTVTSEILCSLHEVERVQCGYKSLTREGLGRPAVNLDVLKKEHQAQGLHSHCGFRVQSKFLLACT